MPYENRLFVVTGAAGGIGRELVRLVAGRGARCLLIDRDAEGLEALRAELDPERTAVFASALRSPQECEEALDATDGPVFAYVSLAGSLPPEDFAEDPRRTWDLTLADNLTHVFDMAVAVSRRLDEERVCRMVLTSSVDFRRGSADHVGYGAAKAGVAGLVRSLARRFAPHVLVNGVAPGHIESPLPRLLWADKARSEKLMAEIPLRRRGHPREVASVIDFLCSEASAYVTGQVINVDGGIVND
ncbi:SDR family oxidoreductase [Geminicoccaceae bacterium 1502E]|nr:SDR family oxidoreductase [Geminicoccaceae bacterium 1502E]